MLGRQIRSQEPQIGLMKALGYRTRTIELHYLATAVGIALAGALLGILLGIPLGRALHVGLCDRASAFHWSKPASTPRSSDWVSCSVSSRACSAPGDRARQVARLEPASAMRPRPAAQRREFSGRAAFFERLPWSAGLDAGYGDPNVLRGRRRTLTTGLGVIFAFVLVLG